MFEIHASSWPVAVSPDDPRDLFHRTALAEARVATDRNPRFAAPPVEHTGLVERLRLAFTRPSEATQPCNCPA